MTDLMEKPALWWNTLQECEAIVAKQRARGLSFTTEILPASKDGGCPDAPEWAHVIRYRNAD